jgi:hypothetical protein
MVPIMSARTTRQAARERILKTFQAALDQMIPVEESRPLRGSRFIDFEDQVEALSRQVLPVVLKERAALESSAKVDLPGPCPHCGSPRVYLKREETQSELHSPHGPVVIPKQHARCRACGKTFSPAGARMGPADGSSADAARGPADGT